MDEWKRVYKGALKPSDDIITWLTIIKGLELRELIIPSHPVKNMEIFG